MGSNLLLGVFFSGTYCRRCRFQDCNWESTTTRLAYNWDRVFLRVLPVCFLLYPDARVQELEWQGQLNRHFEDAEGLYLVLQRRTHLVCLQLHSHSSASHYRAHCSQTQKGRAVLHWHSVRLVLAQRISALSHHLLSGTREFSATNSSALPVWIRRLPSPGPETQSCGSSNTQREDSRVRAVFWRSF
jgi:hypothetical protein